MITVQDEHRLVEQAAVLESGEKLSESAVELVYALEIRPYQRAGRHCETGIAEFGRQPKGEVGAERHQVGHERLALAGEPREHLPEEAGVGKPHSDPFGL